MVQRPGDYQCVRNAGLKVASLLREKAQAVSSAAKTLHAAAKDEDVNQQELVLRTAVQSLSMSLVCCNYTHNAFENLVVYYCCLRAITNAGSWQSVKLFAPFLSGIIHCAQCWLL